MSRPVPVDVESYSGHTFAERPLAFLWNERCYLVETIVKQWRSPEGPGFRVVTTDGIQCDLLYGERQDKWTLCAPEGERASQPNEHERKEHQPHA